MAASACLARAAARPGSRVRGSPVDTSLTSSVLSDQRAAAGVGGPDRARARAAAGMVVGHSAALSACTPAL